jgi:hypothetical protein
VSLRTPVEIAAGGTLLCTLLIVGLDDTPLPTPLARNEP